MTLTCCIAWTPPAALLIAVGAASAVATLCGGVLALGLRRFGGVFAAIAGGAMTAVALLDLLPEALDLARPAYSPLEVVGALAAGFVVYLLVDRRAPKAGAGRGRMAAASLTGHSLVDGLGVGVAFQVSAGAGMVVAAAVIAHDIIDGLSTVSASRSGGAGRLEQGVWLIADAAAPLAGILLASQAAISGPSLALLLAAFAGFFLFIGSRQLLELRHAEAPRFAQGLAALAGLALIFGAITLGRG
jgi:ZIP family zinc transporter